MDSQDIPSLELAKKQKRSRSEPKKFTKNNLNKEQNSHDSIDRNYPIDNNDVHDQIDCLEDQTQHKEHDRSHDRPNDRDQQYKSHDREQEKVQERVRERSREWAKDSSKDSSKEWAKESEVEREKERDRENVRKINIPKNINFNEIKSKSSEDLMDLAENLDIPDPSSFKFNDLLVKVVRRYTELGCSINSTGVLEMMHEGHGFLRSPELNYISTQFDILIPGQKARKWNLKAGDLIVTQIKPPKDNEKYFSATNILLINSKTNTLKHRVHFENLTPLYPQRKINLEMETGSKEDISLRICDLMVPIGFGQRALIIAQPRAGKTVLMQNMAHAISKNHPDVELMVLLIDERPEEVTDMKRSVKGEVISSTFDEPANRHIQIAELIIEKAKRLVEQGKDVVLFLDSITRLARAYNTVTPSSGKILTGGIDASAMEGPKRIFGSARNTEEQGSLTIIATALDKNKSQMDYYILQEFAGTGNCEIYLDKALADKRIYPALEITNSGTRNEERFFDDVEMQRRWAIRRVVIPMGAASGIDFLSAKIKSTKNNADLFRSLNG
jgi:transcription termination factor Rho